MEVALSLCFQYDEPERQRLAYLYALIGAQEVSDRALRLTAQVPPSLSSAPSFTLIPRCTRDALDIMLTGQAVRS